jgi:Major tropism determinant N-terminal domain
MSLQIRRGTAAQLGNITPIVGELIYTTDTQLVYVGDGSTVGGIPVAVGGSGNVSGTNLLTLGIASALGNVYGGNVLTGGQVSATGNVYGNVFVGNGAGLTDLVTSVNANALTGNTLSPGVTNSSLTSFGTLTSLSIAGNVRAANAIISGAISAAGNITAFNVSSTNYTGVRVSVAGNVTGGNLIMTGSGFLAGDVSATGNLSGANIIAAGSISATGNVTGAYFIGEGSSLANVIVNANTLVGSYLSSNVINSNLTSVGTLGSLSVSGNIAVGNVTATNITGTLTTASQNNITSVGTLSSLSVTANVLAGNLTTGGQVSAVGNIRGGNLLINTNINAGGNISASGFTGTTVSVTANIVGGNIATAGQLSGVTISASGNVIASRDAQLGGGLLVQTAYTGPYPDGLIVDYVTANGRISTAENDGIQFYNQGQANVWLGGFQADGSFIATGNVTGAQSLTVGNLSITANTISSSTQTITLGGVGNTGNIIIAGNLQVLGNTTTINSNSVSTNDLVVYLANNASSSSQVNGAGLGIGPLGVYGGWTYNNIANTWTTGLGISATGTVTGGNIVTGGALSVTGVTTVNAGNAATAIVNGGTNGSGNIGSSGAGFNTVFANATTAQYADLAENYTADADYASGTVVIFGGEQQITITNEIADERVAGAVSTQPAHLMNAGSPGVAVALRGQVPVKVIGPVTKGDSLVTSSTAGFAQSVGRSRLYGQAVFAKALETELGDGEKTIIAVIL